MKIEFHKYQGTGNDFIIIDNYHREAPALTNHTYCRDVPLERLYDGCNVFINVNERGHNIIPFPIFKL